MVSVDPSAIRQAAERLAAGGLVAFPTETVYGLGADAMSPAAIDRVYAVKGRPAGNPLIVHVTGSEMARRVVANWPDEAQRLAEALWPGPITLVLAKAASVPARACGGGTSVAVRAPDHPAALALIERFGGPIVGPSANPSGRVSPTTAAHVRESFAPEDVMVLDGGPCRGGIESTVLDLTGPVPRVLRPGLITPAQIERVLGRPVEFAGEGGRAAATPRARRDGEPLSSPGLLPQHYAPRTPALLVSSEGWEVLLRGGGGRVAVLTLSGRLVVPVPHLRIQMPPGPREYAARLYAALREADASGCSLIAIERPEIDGPDAALWSAIVDRLQRATAKPGVR